MNFEKYSERFLDYFDSLSDEDLEEVLNEIGLEKYFSAFSKKVQKYEVKRSRIEKIDNCSLETYKETYNEDTKEKFNYKLKKSLTMEINPEIYECERVA